MKKLLLASTFIVLNITANSKFLATKHGFTVRGITPPDKHDIALIPAEQFNLEKIRQNENHTPVRAMRSQSADELSLSLLNKKTFPPLSLITTTITSQAKWGRIATPPTPPTRNIESHKDFPEFDEISTHKLTINDLTFTFPSEVSPLLPAKIKLGANKQASLN